MEASWFRLKHELSKPDNEFLFYNHIFWDGFVYMNHVYPVTPGFQSISVSMFDASHSWEGCTKSLWPPHSTYPPSNHSGTPSRLYRSKNLMDFVVRSRSAEAFHHTLNICHVAEIIPFTCAWNLTLCGLRVESTLARCYQIISISCPRFLLGVSLKYLCVYVMNLM